MTARPTYRRVLLKASGEALMGEQHFGIDVSVVDRIAADIAEARAMGVEVGVVIGGGNIFRGVAVASKGGDRVTGDHMGMLATVINSLALAHLAGQARRRGSRAFGDRHAGTLRKLFAAPGDRLHGPGQGRDLRRRHRQPLLHHQFGGSAARRGDRRRRAVQGHAGRRRLFGRSEEGPERDPLRAHQPCRRASARACRSWTRPQLRLRAKTTFR